MRTIYYQFCQPLCQYREIAGDTMNQEEVLQPVSQLQEGHCAYSLGTKNVPCQNEGAERVVTRLSLQKLLHEFQLLILRGLAWFGGF